MTLLERVFRANPRYQLVVFERMDTSESERFASAFRGGGGYGVLRDREHGGPLRVVDPDVALLLLTLADPLPFPSYARQLLGDQAERVVRRLVLDGMLEFADRDGTFVTGQAALACFDSSRPRPASRLAELSETAVRWAAELGTDDAGALTGYLYWFNTVPLSRELEADRGWTQRIKSLANLSAGWQTSNGAAEWCMGSPRQHVHLQAGALTYKLYVSVFGEDIVQAADALLSTLLDLGPRPLKFGAHRRALSRPDKLVVYFATLDELHAVASAVAPKLERLRPHGVPFSAPIDFEGRLSWGIDPPHALDAGEHESWRYRVTVSLAQALGTALASGETGADPWQFALRRAALDGVDVETWTPQGSLLLAEGRN